ncbi:hypothetical protein RRG08_000380 [Elysia crispata]|uniref:C-type lectin domain-containing protein n=1 Tax=Elysia crispata TaxID=231223 RepID=A0AAE0Z853_9GAST|nr:hypothetical protein RRG08_000380 [Elysia crispata]
MKVLEGSPQWPRSISNETNISNENENIGRLESMLVAMLYGATGWTRFKPDFYFSIGLNFCSSGWLQSPTSYSCIKFYHEKKSWGDARNTCQAVNGNLIINLDDKKENLIAAQRKRHTDEEFWIGLNDRKNEDHFKWLDGTQMISKTYWDDDQPDDEHDNEDCVVLRNAKSSIAKWNDLTCSKHRKFICEFFPDCPGNTFGGRCTDICNLTCGGANNTCKRFDGFCINGCYIGYQGNTCDALHKQEGVDCQEAHEDHPFSKPPANVTHHVCGLEQEKDRSRH